jgi:hypothetical protein
MSPEEAIRLIGMDTERLIESLTCNAPEGIYDARDELHRWAS